MDREVSRLSFNYKKELEMALVQWSAVRPKLSRRPYAINRDRR